MRCMGDSRCTARVTSDRANVLKRSCAPAESLALGASPAHRGRTGRCSLPRAARASRCLRGLQLVQPVASQGTHAHLAPGTNALAAPTERRQSGGRTAELASSRRCTCSELRQGTDAGAMAAGFNAPETGGTVKRRRSAHEGRPTICAARFRGGSTRRPTGHSGKQTNGQEESQVEGGPAPVQDQLEV